MRINTAKNNVVIITFGKYMELSIAKLSYIKYQYLYRT